MKALIGVLALVVLGALWQASASASGSISIDGGISPRDAYTQGKKLTFKKLVCSSCPIQRGELDQSRAMSLKNSLEARDAESKPGTSFAHAAVIAGRNTAASDVFSMSLGYSFDTYAF